MTVHRTAANTYAITQIGAWGTGAHTNTADYINNNGTFGVPTYRNKLEYVRIIVPIKDIRRTITGAQDTPIEEVIDPAPLMLTVQIPLARYAIIQP